MFAVLFFIDVIIYSFIHVGSIAIQIKLKKTTTKSCKKL